MPLKLISNFKTGFDQELEPWLLMDDAFVEMDSYEIERGFIQCRKGFEGYAVGGRGGAPSEQSRIQNAVTAEAVADTNQAFTHTLANIPIRPGSLTITDDTGTPQVLTDDGAGALTGAGTGTVNYQTGAIAGTWTVAPTAPITAAYTYAEDKPVMMIANYINDLNNRDLIVASTDVFNKYNPATNRFDVLAFAGTAAAPTGANYQFFSWTNYPTKTGAPRLVMSNNKDGIYTYNGTNIQLLSDGGDYAAPALGAINYCQAVYYFGERLVLVKPTVGGNTYKNMIMFSGIRTTDGNGDKFNGIGSGYVFLSTQSTITASGMLGDKLVIWTTEEAYEVSVTEDSDNPFYPRRIRKGGVHGSQCPYSAVEILDENQAVHHFGIHGTDGRSIFRVDQKLPEFTKNRMSGLDDGSEANSGYDYVFGATMNDLERVWWTYADVDDAAIYASRILSLDYMNNTWAIQSSPISCMGEFLDTTEVPWDNVDGDEGSAWASWDTTTNIWDSFYSQKAVYKSLSGNHHGFIFYHAAQYDFEASISGITSASPAVVTTEPDIFTVGDIVRIDGVTGYEDVNGDSVVNGLEFEVTAVNHALGTVTLGLDGSLASAYTSGGQMLRVIPRSMTTKAFNPFIEEGKQCRLKTVWLLIDTDKSTFRMDLYCDRRPNPYRVNVQIDDGTNFGDAEKKWVAVTVNQVATFHTLRLYSNSGPANERLHAIILDAEPVGRLYR